MKDNKWVQAMSEKIVTSESNRIYYLWQKKKSNGIGELFHRSSKNIFLVLNGFILYSL